MDDVLRVDKVHGDLLFEEGPVEAEERVPHCVAQFGEGRLRSPDHGGEPVEKNRDLRWSRLGRQELRTVTADDPRHVSRAARTVGQRPVQVDQAVTIRLEACVHRIPGVDSDLSRAVR